MDNAKLMSFIIEAASFVAAFAGIAATIVMSRFVRKFVTGILADGFKTVSIGILFLALGIIIDAIELYTRSMISQSIINVILIVRQIFFVIGAYIIVIGSKNMGDKLETLSKHKTA